MITEPVLLDLILGSLVILTIFGSISFFSPLSTYEKTFLTIVELLNIFSTIHYDEELKEDAYKKMIKISEDLEQNQSLRARILII